MTFAYTIKRFTIFGNMRVVLGSFTGAAGTTDTIVTGLNSIEHVEVTDITGVRASMSIDYTTTAGSIAISGMTASDAGTFFAIGK